PYEDRMKGLHRLFADKTKQPSRVSDKARGGRRHQRISDWPKVESVHYSPFLHLAHRNAKVGRTKRLSVVEVTSPPRITTAIGPSISQPASLLLRASGNRPRAVTVAVIRMGTRRSDAPRMAVPKFQVWPSWSTRCS